MAANFPEGTGPKKGYSPIGFVGMGARSACKIMDILWYKDKDGNKIEKPDCVPWLQAETAMVRSLRRSPWRSRHPWAGSPHPGLPPWS